VGYKNPYSQQLAALLVLLLLHPLSNAELAPHGKGEINSCGIYRVAEIPAAALNTSLFFLFSFLRADD